MQGSAEDHAGRVDRTFQPYRSRAEREAPLLELRSRVEATRLDLCALFRSIDRRRVLQDFPDELRVLAELDADLAEALWVLNQPGKRFDLGAMSRDTLASLDRIPTARAHVLALLEPSEQADLDACVEAVRASLRPEEAYAEVPGGKLLAR